MQDTKRSIVAWAFYDWANSAFATTVMAGFFPVFFSAYWAVGSSAAEGTFYLGLANSIGSATIAILAPFLGSIADWGSYKKRLLAFFALLGAVMTASLSLLQMGNWPMAVVIYLFAMVSFAGGNTFYDALLPYVASEEKVDFVSSLGYSLGYIGGGLLFAVNVFMFLNPEWFSIVSQEQAVKLSFVMVGIWWAVFSLPILLFVKEEKSREALPLSQAIRKGMSVTINTVKSFRSLRTISFFLVAYWLYIDGVDTIIVMAVAYGTSLGFPSESLIVALLITQFVAFPSALLYALFAKKVGVRRALQVAIGAYTFIAILGFFMNKPLHFYLLAVAIGFQGGIQALAALLHPQSPRAGAEFFGFSCWVGVRSDLGPCHGLVSPVAAPPALGSQPIILAGTMPAKSMTKGRRDGRLPRPGVALPKVSSML